MRWENLTRPGSTDVAAAGRRDPAALRGRMKFAATLALKLALSAGGLSEKCSVGHLGSLGAGASRPAEEALPRGQSGKKWERFCKASGLIRAAGCRPLRQAGRPPLHFQPRSQPEQMAGKAFYLDQLPLTEFSQPAVLRRGACRLNLTRCAQAGEGGSRWQIE